VSTYEDFRKSHGILFDLY